MVAEQDGGIPYSETRVDEQEDGHGNAGRSSAAGDVDRAVGDEEGRRGDRAGEERDEVAVVSLSDAVVDPEAVVVMGHYAGSAGGAVEGARRSPYPASCTVLDLDFAERIGSSAGRRQADAVAVLLRYLETVAQLR